MLLAVHYLVSVHLESSERTQEARVTLGYRLKQLSLQLTSHVHHNSMVHHLNMNRLLNKKFINETPKVMNKGG